MQTSPKPNQCRHLFTDGRQCGSYSLRNENFCYYHHTTRVPAPRPSQTQRGASDIFVLPMPENRAAIQHALGEVLRRVAASQIADRTANLLFYGLSIASNNLPRPTQADVIAIPDTEPVRDIIIDPEEGLLAPAAEPLQEGQRLTTPGVLRQAEVLAHERYAREAIERIVNYRQPPKPPLPAAPPNSPELERLLKLYPPPPHIGFLSTPKNDPQGDPQNDPPAPPKPWQTTSPQASEAPQPASI